MMHSFAKPLFVLASVLLLGDTQALAAGNGSSNANENAQSQGGGNGDSRGGDNGNGGGNGSEGRNQNGKVDKAVGSDSIVAVPDDQEVVQNAVRAKSALSLEQITAVVRRDSDGRILDVKLVTFKGIYLYDVTVLEADGVLHKLYYNARSGAPVRTK